MQTFENLLLYLHYRQNNSKRQFELTANVMQTFENILLQNNSTEF